MTEDEPAGRPVVYFDRAVPADVADLLDDRLTAVGPDEEHLGLAVAVVSGSRRWDAPSMDRVPHLRVISRTGVGYDNIDVGAATARGVTVCHAADGPTVSTAEHTIALLLAITKLVPAWDSPPRLGVELDGLTLGLLGLGRIGRRVATIGRALGMRIIAHDPFVAVADHGTELVELTELWSASDVVSLHAPATPLTHHVVDESALAAMRPGAFLVNCARGALVDHDALLGALASGRLAGVALDVTVPEPLPADHPLRSHPRAIVTPHIASSTTSGRRRLYGHAIANALAALAGDRSSAVPEQR